MEIPRSSWHARVYTWWYTNKYGPVPETSNLCPYMRAILIWAPIRLLFWHWVKLPITLKLDGEKYKVPLNAITIPIITIALPILVGYFSYQLKMTLLVVYLICAAVGLFLLLCFFIIVISESVDLKGAKNFLHRKTVGTSFGGLLARYLRSFHDGVCPTLEIK